MTEQYSKILLNSNTVSINTQTKYCQLKMKCLNGLFLNNPSSQLTKGLCLGHVKVEHFSEIDLQK